MSLFHRLFNMVRRMTVYGLVLGGAAGLLVTLTILLVPSMERPTFFGLPLDTQTIMLWSGILGMLYGTIAGFTCGIGMVLFTVLLFRDMPSTRYFRWFMGSTTFMLTIATFVGRGLWGFGDGIIEPMTWNTTMLMAVVIAIYASQRTATKYLLDSRIQKLKL